VEVIVIVTKNTKASQFEMLFKGECSLFFLVDRRRAPSSSDYMPEMLRFVEQHVQGKD